MTTIDQAFIRAYLQQTARDVPKRDAAAEAAASVGGKADRTDRPETKLPPVTELVTSSMVEPIRTAVSMMVTESLAEPVCPPRPEPRVAPAPPPVVEDRPRPTPAEVAFQPMLQVDDFAWSERATSLRLAAGIQVDRLADALAAGIAEGRNVAAIAGCGRRQGCTTMLLCVAKRLADRGLKVAMMDADFAHPALAASLGLLPEEGVEAVLAGRASLEDVAIESIGDEMTVVPLAAPAAALAESPQGLAAQAAAVEVLRRCCDLVLVDVGDATGRGSGGSRSGRGAPRWADAVVAVQDVRSTAQAEAAELLRRAEDEGVVSLGVVENFV